MHVLCKYFPVLRVNIHYMLATTYDVWKLYHKFFHIGVLLPTGYGEYLSYTHVTA